MWNWVRENRNFLFGGIGIALILWALNLVLRIVGPKIKNRRSLNRVSSRSASSLDVVVGEIIFPKPGSKVSQSITCEGILSDVGSDQTCWLMVEVGDLMWPKEGVIQADGVRAPKVRASWFDPRYGIETPLHATTSPGIQTFAPPTSGRGCDWMLILEAVSD